MTETLKKPTPTGKERHFAADELIVSKTDLKGRVTYANDVFLKIAGYRESEILGQPHSLIRHPDMPRCVFKLLWDEISAGREIFAYVINMAKNGDHYWVYAHVTPSFDQKGAIIGYHSSRRVVDPRVVNDVIKPLYAQLRKIEESHANRKDGMNAAMEAVVAKLQSAGVSYDQFVQSL
ncbi:PAS domain-containing protein [Thalassospira sp.]|uniref:PAS domain-containing protein n=1 Tax=Thalassospira sp. TaxID=1912094 RepID=UPI002733E8F9|nr:PAS domain-containing protein [Thalassospira sp.]MDP2698935.1 PAS domain-containing protein [Thalassospira sp.]